MSGRKPKKNQRLGSSRRGTRGLRVNEEKDNDECEDGQNECRTTTDNQSGVTVSHGQSDHLPSLSIDHKTLSLECSSHAGLLSHKDSDVEAEVPERKRKIGSTRKRAGGLKNERKLEPCDEVKTSEEFGEEQVAQPNTSGIEGHTSPTKDEQSNHEQSRSWNFPSNLSQTRGSGLGVEPGAAQNIEVMVSQNKENDAIHHQEITPYSPTTGLVSYEEESDMRKDVAIGQSAHSSAVTATESGSFLWEDSEILNQSKTLSGQETPLASMSGPKRKMGSTRRPLRGNRENVDAQEISSMREDVWKAEVIGSGESEFSMLDEMLQMWNDDVKRNNSPTTTSSHTESSFVSNQSLSSERAVEPDVSAGTETNNQSVACSVFDPTKPLPEISSHHRTPLLNKESFIKMGSDTIHQTKDFNVCHNVTITASPPTQSDSHAVNSDLEEISNFSDSFQNVPDTRNDINTSEDWRSEEFLKLKEEPSRNDAKIISTSKQDPQLDELLFKGEGSPSSPCSLDSATKENCDDSTNVLTAEGCRTSDRLESEFNHAQPTAIDSTPDMRDNGLDIHSLEDEEKKALMESSISGKKRNMGSTQSKRTEHKDENLNMQATEEGLEIHSEVQQGVEEEHSANETNESDSSLCSANYNLANLSPVAAHLHDSNLNLSSPLPEDSKLSYDVMDEIAVCSQLNNPTINNEESAASFPEAENVAENLEIYVETEEEKDIYDTTETSVTCDITVTELVMDLKDITEQDVGLQTVSTRENESVGTKTGPKTDTFEMIDQDNVNDHNITQTFMDARDNGEGNDTTETVRILNQEPCEVTEEKEEITLEQQQRLESNTFQIQGGALQDDTEKGLENEILEDIESDVHQQLFSLNSDKESYDFIQGVFLENAEDEILLNTKLECPAIDREDEPSENSKEIEDLKVTESTEHLTSVNVQDNDSQSDLQTQNQEQNRVLTGEEKDTSPDMILEELQVTECAENVSTVTDCGLCFEDVVTVDSGESHTVCEQKENISEIFEESQNEDIQSKLKPLVHKRKMGSTRRPLRGNKGQRKDREPHGESETPNSESLINEEKEQEREINEEIVAGPAEVLDSALMLPSCSSDLVSQESTAEKICDITESQTLIKCNAESQENAGDAESVPVGRDTEPHLQITTEVKILHSTIVEEGTEENICDVNVVARQAEFAGDAVTVESNMTIESDFLPNFTSPDTNQESLKASENVENISAVTDSGLVLRDAVTESSLESNTVPEKTEISIIPEDSQGEDSHSKLNPIVHKRKMGSTRRPLRGNKEKSKRGKEEKEEESEAVAEEDTDPPPETQDQNNVIDHNILQTMVDVRDKEKDETAETLRRSIQDVCDDAADKETWHREMAPEPEPRTSLNTSQTQEDPQVDSEMMLERVREVGEEKDRGTENTAIHDQAIKSEEIFTPEDINSTVTVTSFTHQQLFIQTTDEGVRDFIQRGEGVYENSEEEDMFLRANTEHADVDRRNETSDQSKEIEDLKVTESTEHLTSVNVQGNDSQSDLQTQNQEQNRVLTGEEKDTSPDMILEELQVTERAENVSTVTDCGLCFEDVVTVDSGESHTVCEQKENISEISEDIESKLKPLVHKRKIGSTRRPLRSNKGQRKDREPHDESETPNCESLINEEKEQEREINEEIVAGPVEVLDSALMLSSCSSDLVSQESTAEKICDITESQTLIKCNAESQENAGDAESVPEGRDTEPHLQITTEVKILDSTIVEEGTEDNICDVNVLTRQAEFAKDTVTVESNMTIESNLLQNITSPQTNQEALKASENVENISAVTDSGLVLRDAVTESSLESNTVPEKTEISIIPEDSQREDSHSKLNPIVHKRKMGSTRRPLRGNKEKSKRGKEEKEEESEAVAEEDTDPPPETQDQNNVIDHNILQTMVDVRDKEKDETAETLRRSIQEVCDDAADKETWHREMAPEPEPRTSLNTSQTQEDPQVDSEMMLERVREVGEEKDRGTENTAIHDQAINSEEIFTPEDINSTVTVTSLTHQQLFIQTTDEGVRDFIQRGEAVYENSEEEEMFLRANTEHADVDRRNETSDQSKEIEDLKVTESTEHLTSVNVQGNDSQSDLQTQNQEQNRVLTGEEKDTSPDMILEELQVTERAENVSTVTDCGLCFEDVVTVDSGESHTVCEQRENISQISEESQNEEIQSKLNPLVHRRKMGSTRRPLRGNKGQRKDREPHGERETLNSESLINEEKEQEREINEEIVAGPAEVLDSALMLSSCSSDLLSQESTAERICDIAESQTLKKFNAESQRIAGDAESVPVGGDTESHLEMTSEIKIFDSTFVEEGTEENICDVNVPTKQAEFAGDAVTVESNMTIESDFLPNITSPDTNQEALKASENVENISAVTDSGLVLRDAVTESSLESNTVPEKTEISIIPEDSQGEDSHSKLNPIVHKRKMGSTRRPLRGNKGQRKDSEPQDESETPNSESLINEEKEQEREINEEIVAGPVEVLDSALMLSSCSSDLVSQESTAEKICDTTESQTLIKCNAESQENAGDAESVPVGRDTEPYLEIKSEIKIFDLTIVEEGTEENICDVNVVTRQAEFAGDAITVESNMTIESGFLQNITSPDTNQEALKTSENVENISAVTDTGLVLRDAGISIIPEDSHGEDSHSKLNPIVPKRKMGSTRRPLRGNKEKSKRGKEEKEGESEAVAEEDTDPPSETQEQKNVEDHNILQNVMDVRHNEEEKTSETVRMSVHELCEHPCENKEWHKEITLDQEQRPSSDIFQTQTGPLLGDSDQNLPEAQERTSEFIKDNPVCVSHSDLVLSDALPKKETQIHVSSELVVTADSPQTENGEIRAISSRSLQKRKMGSTRKTQRGKRIENEWEVGEDKDGETETTPVDEGTTKSEEKFTLGEAISLTSTGTYVHQQLFSLNPIEEGHDIQDNGSKSEEQTENPEPNGVSVKEQNDPNSNTNPEPFKDSECADNITAETASDLHLGSVETYTIPYQSETIISQDSHKEDVQSHLYPVAQKRKMGSTRKALGGHSGRRRRELQSKEMDGDVEREEEERLTEPHLATSEAGSECRFDEDTQFREEVNRCFDRITHPATTSKIFSEPEDGVNEVAMNIFDLSVVSEGNLINRQDNKVFSEAFSITRLESEMLVSATDLKGDENDYHDNSEPSRPTEPENLDTSRRSLEEVESHAPQISDNQLTVSDQSHQVIHSDVIKLSYSEKHPQPETLNTEKRRKMGSTRKNLRGKKEEKREESGSTEHLGLHLLSPREEQESAIREVGEAERDQIIHYTPEQSEGSLLSEIEKALNQTSQCSQSLDSQLIFNEPNSGDLPNTPIETSYLNTPENSTDHNLDTDKCVFVKSKSPSELNSPGRRRKMGSTRKNPRQQQTKREDEDDDEMAENLEKNKQELNGFKKDLETAEESKVRNITDNEGNKEYLDVPIALARRCLQEESASPVVQEGVSPSTKRKFGSRRTNKGNRGFGGLVPSESRNELEEREHRHVSSEDSDEFTVRGPCFSLQTENQPMIQPSSEYRNMEARNVEPVKSGPLVVDATQQEDTGAGLVSLGQIIRPGQHDKGSGKRQASDLKSTISDGEVPQFNVVMVGNSCVGKTSFIRRFHDGQFSLDYCSTIGVDTCIQSVVLDDRVVKLQIWDTAGQERFHSITTQVFHRADGLLLMYDITSSKSFMSVHNWISQVQEKAPDDVIMMLLGNKVDCVKREVLVQEGEALAKEYKIHFMECSAATGNNVSECMRILAELLVQHKRQKMEKHPVLKKEKQQKSGCC